jgi:heme-degrading monooxygenase HmoA
MKTLALLALLLAPLAAHASPAKVARMWHGRVKNEKAAEYEKYLTEAVKKFPTIKGNLGYQVMKETVGAETHFSVISYWASRDAIKAYAGEDIRKVHSLPKDPEYLVEVEPTVMNYDLAVDAKK